MATIQLYFYSINERHSRGINYHGLHATNKNTNTYKKRQRVTVRLKERKNTKEKTKKTS